MACFFPFRLGGGTVGGENLLQRAAGHGLLASRLRREGKGKDMPLRETSARACWAQMKIATAVLSRQRRIWFPHTRLRPGFAPAQGLETPGLLVNTCGTRGYYLPHLRRF